MSKRGMSNHWQNIIYLRQLHTASLTILCSAHGRNLVGDTGDVFPHFSDGGI